MNIETQKIELAKYILNTHNESLLEQISSLVQEDMVAYTTSGLPLSKDQYIERIKVAEQQIVSGEYLTQEEVQEAVNKW